MKTKTSALERRTGTGSRDMSLTPSPRAFSLSHARPPGDVKPVRSVHVRKKRRLVRRVEVFAILLRRRRGPSPRERRGFERRIVRVVHVRLVSTGGHPPLEPSRVLRVFRVQNGTRGVHERAARTGQRRRSRENTPLRAPPRRRVRAIRRVRVHVPVETRLPTLVSTLVSTFVSTLVPAPSPRDVPVPVPVPVPEGFSLVDFPPEPPPKFRRPRTSTARPRARRRTRRPDAPPRADPTPYA